MDQHSSHLVLNAAPQYRPGIALGLAFNGLGLTRRGHMSGERVRFQRVQLFRRKCRQLVRFFANHAQAQNFLDDNRPAQNRTQNQARHHRLHNRIGMKNKANKGQGRVRVHENPDLLF